MQVTYIELSEYFNRCIPSAKKQNFSVIISVIARYADADILYDKLEKDWASLNDLTGGEILFLFSTPQVRKRASFFHIHGKPTYEGVMCPFVELLNGDGVEDKYGPFEFLYDGYKEIDWKQRHSQTITQFARDYNISEEQIPCLFLYDLMNDRYKIIPVSSSEDIYAIVKEFVAVIGEYGRKKAELEYQLGLYKNIDKYCELYSELESMTLKKDSGQAVAIGKVLRGEQSFMAVKSDIKDVKVRRDLKRIGQWKRQYFNKFESDEEEKNKYYKLKEDRKNIQKEFDSIWQRLEKTEMRSENNPPKFLIDLLTACVNLQANKLYFDATEDQRNDYIRDLLKMALYDVKDQTRRGKSSSGIGAGEVDIVIENNRVPQTIIEALNLSRLDKAYLDKHIDKIYYYDTGGNRFNIVLSYVKVSDFEKFCERYYSHIKKRSYKYPLLQVGKVECEMFDFANIQVMQTVHRRSGFETVLYHVCVLIG